MPGITPRSWTLKRDRDLCVDANVLVGSDFTGNPAFDGRHLSQPGGRPLPDAGVLPLFIPQEAYILKGKSSALNRYERCDFGLPACQPVDFAHRLIHN